MPTEIRPDPLTSKAIAALLQEHLDNMAEISPPESVHALDLQALRQPQLSFWSAWDGDELLGCGALKELDAQHGEIKSMRTANAHRRKGVAARILEHIIATARERGYQRLSLETGTQPPFAPAHALYRRYGFDDCSPFADYSEDPNSTFMTLEL